MIPVFQAECNFSGSAQKINDSRLACIYFTSLSEVAVIFMKKNLETLNIKLKSCMEEMVYVVCLSVLP